MTAMLGCGLAEGLEPALEGLVASLVDLNDRVLLFSTITTIGSFGSIVGGPLIAALMQIGRSSTEPSAGFALLASSVRCLPRFSTARPADLTLRLFLAYYLVGVYVLRKCNPLQQNEIQQQMQWYPKRIQSVKPFLINTDASQS